MPEFQIETDPRVIDTIRAKPKHGALVRALRSGEVVFIAGARTFQGPRTLLKRDGLALRTKAGEKDGVGGCYVWTESKP